MIYPVFNEWKTSPFIFYPSSLQNLNWLISNKWEIWNHYPYLSNPFSMSRWNPIFPLFQEYVTLIKLRHALYLCTFWALKTKNDVIQCQLKCALTETEHICIVITKFMLLWNHIKLCSSIILYLSYQLFSVNYFVGQK